MFRDNEVGERLRARRLLLQLTQTELGERCGVTGQMIQKYETGKSRLNTDMLMSIARALGVPCGYFFPGDANRSIVGDDVLSLVSKPSHAEALILLSKLTAPQKQAVVGLLRAMLDGQVDIADEETGSERSDRPCDAA